MFRPLDLSLTRFAQIRLQQYGKKKQPIKESQSSLTQIESPQVSVVSSFRSISTQGLIRGRNYTVEMQGALFIRNSIRCILRRYFKKMLSRHMLKKICFRLMISKFKRDTAEAFYLLRGHCNLKTRKTIEKFYNRHPELRILICVCNKILNKPQRLALSKINAYSLRRKRVNYFLKCLADKLQNRYCISAAQTFWTLLIMKNSRKQQLLSGMQILNRWSQFKVRSNLQQCYIIIANSILQRENEKDFNSYKQKQNSLIVHNKNKKQVMVKLRQDLKANKVLLDQEKLAKHKVFQDHKKYLHSSKIEMAEAVRKYDKEKKIEEAEFSQIQSELKDWQRMLCARDQIAQNGIGSESRCFSIYSFLTQYKEENLRGMEILSAEIESHSKKFRISPAFYFLKNIRMGKLVQLYEKRESYNYEAQYYQLQYENNVIRQTIRCFIKQRYQAYICRNLRRKTSENGDLSKEEK